MGPIHCLVRLSRGGAGAWLLLWIAIALLPTSAMGWGTHAQVEDLIELNEDWALLNAAVDVLKMPATSLAVEKQNELLGLVGNSGGLDIQAYLVENAPAIAAVLLDAGIRVIRNPSSSCPVAAEVLGKLLGVERQSELLGTTVYDKDFTAQSPFLDAIPKLFREVKYRCITEAYDICVASGSVQPFISLATMRERQMELEGISDPDFVHEIALRMKDCGVYRLEARTNANNLIHYPFDQTYSSTVQSVLRAELRLYFRGDGPPDRRVMPAAVSDLAQAYFLFSTQFELPVYHCAGRHGEHCVLVDFPSPLQPDWNALELVNLIVKYTGTRANFSPEARKLANQRYVLFPITLEQFTPDGMDRDQIVLTAHAPPLTLNVEIGTNPLTEDNVAPQLFESPLEGWTRQSEGDHVEFSLKKILVNVDIKKEAGSRKTVNETGTLVLRHHPDPMTRFDYMQMPEIEIPDLRKPLRPPRPPRMTQPNKPNP
jgi:hypothetical protein